MSRQYKDKYKQNISGLILPVLNKGRELPPFLFLPVFTLENFHVLSPLFEMSINYFED